MNKSIFDFTDFRGGFFTDVPTDLMKDTELLQADNCYWRNGLKKRLGQASFTSYTGSAIRGGIRAKISNIWYTILGIELSATGTVELRIGTDDASTTLTKYDSRTATFTSYTLQYGNDIQFAYLDEKVVAVNGYNKPSVIWASASNFMIDTLEAYDDRLMDNDDWNAGQYRPSLTATAYFTDTADAQSVASSDFTLASTSFTTGFWIGCAHTFNKVTLYDVNATNTTVDPIYEYYGRASSGGATGWIGFTPVNIPTWTAVGNKEIEFNFPIDSNTQEILMDKTASLNSSIGGVYAMRTTMSMTMTTTFSMTCGYVKAEHSQYLTQLLLNDRPDTVATHKSHVMMGSGNWMRVSPYGTLKGWREQDKEYFSEGGLIKAMVPHIDYLAIVLDNAIYGLYGNSWSDWSTKQLIGNKGTINKRSACVVNEELYFVARDGVYGWNGSRLLKLSKHIKTFIDSLTLTDAVAANIRGEYWVSFPTNGYTLIFDPDTLRLDDAGDGRMSFYKFTDYPVSQFLPYFGDSDTGTLRAYRNLGGCKTLTLESNNYDTFTATVPITMTFRTRDMAFGNSQQLKIFRRLKMQVQQASAAAGATYSMVQYANNQAGQASYSTTFTVATGSGVDTVTQGIPPGIDGYTYGISISHNTAYDAKFLGYSVESEKRKY
jgi:hypothetical protein